MQCDDEGNLSSKENMDLPWGRRDLAMHTNCIQREWFCIQRVSKRIKQDGEGFNHDETNGIH